MSLDSIVSKFAEDPFDPQLNFDCALEYDRLEQTASAVSFYLRTAEYGTGVLVYNALLKIAKCFDSQGQRPTTVKNSILQAISYMPERPEAYFLLSQYHERHGNWQECYTSAKLGLKTELYDPLPSSIGYHGDYCLEFENGVSAWWIGQKDESREILERLNKRTDIEIAYKEAIKRNLEHIGVKVEPTIFEMSERVTNIKKALKLSYPAETTFTRLGSVGDGGYVMADDINKNDYIISLGVDKNVDFEKDVAKISNHIFMYDNSIDELPEPVEGALFFKKTMGTKADGHTSLADCILTKFDYILKMDIEGAEFDVLNDASTQTLSKFRQITMEVHWMNQLTDKEFYTRALAAFEKLRLTHTPVLVHPNNDRPLMILGNAPVPVVFEILYLRNDSYTWWESSNPFEGLSANNNVDVPEMSLSFP
jgi:hypothetical protein